MTEILQINKVSFQMIIGAPSSYVSDENHISEENQCLPTLNNLRLYTLRAIWDRNRVSHLGG